MAVAEWLRRVFGLAGGDGRRSSEGGWPDYYRRYATEVDHRIPPDTDLREIPVVVLDAEATGIDVRQDRILCMGGLRVSGNSINLGEKFEAYLPTPPGFERSDAVVIHGIIPNSQRYAYVDEPTLLSDLLEFLDGALIVGHHIGFDVALINQALKRHGAGPLLNQVVDTADLAKRLRPAGYWTPEHDFSLDALARRYRIPLSDRHTALGDCYITGVLWLKLLSRLALRVGRDLQLRDL
ncbi:DNA polymerase-3 subunit epsilon [Lewinella marina]|uniref:DNA polymerase III subunit epsilon n=1 Tax=Neolewinella marina TaxID=438751 RepID=A0A2G0CFP0_9BACT|nr:3'-5' exonuclease [Neolewinella marina]NJB85579.1 DNA polymerase-3 subunit epsilon [Neolewinella marina]PHK98737.1 DNA polymerase III subunit epsilon [Neolewinella marina]